MATKSLLIHRRLLRWERIAEIAREIYHADGSPCLHGDCITAKMAKAVDDARRAEYYERQESRG